MNNLQDMNLTELSNHDMQSIDAGWGFVAVALALCAMAYQYGKDAAERHRRHEAAAK